MKRLVGLLAVSAVLVSGCGIDIAKLVGSGVAATEARTVPDYHAVSLVGGMTVNLKVGADPSCEITADDNLLPVISTAVEDGVLKVSPEQPIAPKTRIFVTLVAPALDSVEIAGAVDLSVSGVNSARFSLDVAGSAEVTLAGQTERLLLDGAGSLEVDALGLEARDVTVDVAGSATVAVHATKTLDVDIAGSGRVTYLGEPEVSQDVSGSGSVRRHGG